MSRELGFQMTQPQAEFLSLDCKFPAFIGGVGSGKSHTMAISGFIDASHSSDAVVAFYEPTHSHLKTIIIPRIENLLIENGISYTLNKQDSVIYTSSSQFGDFRFISLDNPALIVGYECYRSHVDEIDTLTEDKAREAWIKIISRNRQRPKGMKDVQNRVSIYSTPEGFKFVYKTWAISTNPEYKMVKSPTRMNPFLEPDYEQTLRDSFPKEYVDAYLEGDFVNMNSATVYSSYNRLLHESFETIQGLETLYIGCDFNVDNGSATVFVRRDGGAKWHAVAELIQIKDTIEMIRIIKERWASKGHKIVMYPDASGTARKSVNASISDIALLSQAGFEVRAKRKNPDVRDRVMAVNKGFQDNRIFINSHMCPTVARCLEQQSYDKNGEPDKKSGYDHQNDATTYPLAYELAIRKPLFKVDFSFVT